MKKLFCVLLVMTILLSFAACGKEKESKVTIYIPETDTVFQADTVSSQLAVTYIFEEGWQEKESFRVTFSGNTEALGVGNDVPTMIFNGKTVITEMAGVKRSEATYDENGRQIFRITPFLTENATVAKMEFAFTYDAQGRKRTQITKYHYPDKAEPVTETQTYTYVDTETGSKGTYTEGNSSYVLEYDKNYRLVAKVTITDGQEISRTESEYDENGNQIKSISYDQGQKTSESKYTYKAVEVSEETANRLPQFNRGK
ncbi:MAG: hypothetical protein E7433_03990 [Ruminococcaceae bacterium]|nr:hypothetical protein [Oscillospiraceae bacterium]